MRYSIMLRKLNLFLSLLTVIITISPLVQAKGRDGYPRGQKTRTEHHQVKISKDKQHSQLTAEQRETIKSKVSQMKEAESTPKAIKQTVDQMMQNFGVEPTQRKGKGRAKRQNPLGQLTEEQKSHIDTKIKEMREAGANRDEIRKQMGTMLEGFGVDISQRKGKRKGKDQNTLDQLTEEQKSQVDAKVKEMREAGTDRREVRNQVHSMLEGFGLKKPQKKKGRRRGFRGRGKRRYTTLGQTSTTEIETNQ